MPQDDPTELFDLCDRDGKPLGRAKPRALVHRDGDWHRSVHLWVVLDVARERAVLLQRRSLTKDTHPGRVDCAVAGHLAAGEPSAEAAALREAREEVGLVVRKTDLVRLGTRIRDGGTDREVQEIFCVIVSQGLESLRPDPDEVLGLLAVPLEAARALFEGETQEAAGQELHTGEAQVREALLRRAELLLAKDGYFPLAMRSIARRLEGANEEPWCIG